MISYDMLNKFYKNIYFQLFHNLTSLNPNEFKTSLSSAYFNYPINENYKTSSTFTFYLNYLI
jgi:hypothetical protein